MKISAVNIGYNNQINENKTKIQTRNTSCNKTFKGFEQRAFIAEMNAMLKNKEIPAWQKPFRDIMKKADVITAFAENLMPKGQVTFPKAPKLNLRMFDNIRTVDFNIFGTYISTQKQMPFNSESSINTIFIPHGLGSLEMGDDKGIVVHTNIIDENTNKIKRNETATYTFDGKTVLEINNTLFFYDKESDPVQALKNVKVNKNLSFNVYYDRDGFYDSTYFYNQNGDIIKSDKVLGECYYKNGQPLCYLDPIENVYDPEGYFMFKL